MARLPTPTTGTQSTNSGSETFVAQEGGDHYQAEYQHWDWVPDIGMGYLAGNATKYVSRWQKKNGIQDLLKGMSYVDKILTTDMTHYRRGMINERVVMFNNRFYESASLKPVEQLFCSLMSLSYERFGILQAKAVLQTILDDAGRAAKGQARPPAPTAPSTGPSPALAPPCGGAGHAIGQGQTTTATAGSQVSGLTGMENPFGYDEEDGA